jgi:predicted DsbA family dithiol-disulfide isomerase
MTEHTDSTGSAGDGATAGSDSGTPAEDDPLVVYSDFVCPFCYLGKTALEQYREDAADPPAVEWRPFDLRSHKRGPDGAIDWDAPDGKDEDYFAEVRENVDRLRERYDAEMLSFDEIPEDVDSWNAQLVALAVRRGESDALGRLNDALFEALWIDGRDIGDPEVLRDVAEAVGLDPTLVDETFADETLEADLREAFEDAQRAGVSAVPTFVYGEYAARGAVPPAQLRRLVEGV